MGQKVTRTDFDRSYTDEPHASRRREILKKYPEIKKLFGPDPKQAVWVILMVMLQMFCMSWAVTLNWPMLLFVSYAVSGTINMSLATIMHENSHNLVFGYKYPMASKILGIIIDLPIGLPTSVTFKQYHMDHHKFQGYIDKDTDTPTELEAKLFSTTFGKAVWAFLLPIFYMGRPILIYPKPISRWQYVNIVVQLLFNAAVLHFVGYKGLVYMIGGSFMASGIHPMGAHVIAEHYMFTKGQETYSYYGPLNLISSNGGYHNEHHDFPFVPGSRLPQVRAMAPEFYDNLEQHESWPGVIYKFIMDPSIGPYSRIIRDRADFEHKTKSI